MPYLGVLNVGRVEVATDKRVEVPDRVNVLLVEDDQATADMYRLKLELDDYRVDLARDGAQAVHMALESPPDLIFLDLRLPKLDGLGVLEALRGDSRTAHVPVVILSNYGEGGLVQRGIELGALEHLIKSETTPAQVSGRVKAWSNKVAAQLMS